MVSNNIFETNKETIIFQLFFLQNKDLNIEVVEIKKINFEEVKSRIERGESVFITRKNKQKMDLNQITREPWYFVHF